MPVYTGISGHGRLCQLWGIECCLYRSWPPRRRRNCLLDKNSDWHTFHDEDRAEQTGLADYSQARNERPEPTLRGCVALLNSVLKELRPRFDELFSEVPDVPYEEVRLCWTAHLVADFACRYWYEGKGQTVPKYTHMDKEDQHAMRDFVKDVGDLIPPITSAYRP
jgi:hypothetical protein